VPQDQKEGLGEFISEKTGTQTHWWCLKEDQGAARSGSKRVVAGKGLGIGGKDRGGGPNNGVFCKKWGDKVKKLKNRMVGGTYVPCNLG